MPFSRWIESTNHAIEGILHAARTQRHVRYHLYSALAVLTLSYVLGVERREFLIIAVTVTFVIFAEMVNTAIEHVVDLLSPDHSESARMAKDVAAGAVLITAFGALVIGYVVLFPYLSVLFESGISVARHAKDEVALISVIAVLILVIVLKAYTGKGHPLRGGMPSGHTAFAFSVWTAISFITANFKVSLLGFVLACAVAHSRVVIGAHNYIEVVVGAMVGTLTTFVLFLLLS